MKPRLSISCVCLVVTSLVACGGTDPSTGSGGEGGEAQNGSGGSGASGTGGGLQQLPIDPITVGNRWTYEVEEIGSLPLCPSGSHTAEALSESELDGKTAIEVTSVCANAPSSFYAVDGDVVQVNYEGTWVLALDAPVEEGHTWSNGVSTFTWHDEGEVMVGAGKFEDCWRATQNVDYEAYTIFCRGVGPVRWRSVDLAGNGFEAVLTQVSIVP